MAHMLSYLILSYLILSYLILSCIYYYIIYIVLYCVVASYTILYVEVHQQFDQVHEESEMKQARLNRLREEIRAADQQHFSKGRTPFIFLFIRLFMSICTIFRIFVYLFVF